MLGKAEYKDYQDERLEMIVKGLGLSKKEYEKTYIA